MNQRTVHTDGRNPDFIELCRLLDQNLDEIVGGAVQRQVYIQYNSLDDISDVVVIYDGEQAVACGSFKSYDEDTAELKRVFVRNEFRGRGLSKILMTELEHKAAAAGFRRLILETGKPLRASMGLYRSVGYRIIDNYGQYKNMKNSVCMEKYIEVLPR